MVLGLQRFNDCVDASDGGKVNGRPLLDADAGEELMRVEPCVAVALGSRPLELPGTLYVTNRRVIWLSDTEKGKGYAVDFLSLSLHAVSRDPEAYPFPCIYTQLEVEDDDDEEFDGSLSESHGELELSKVSEMRLVPSDAGQLDALFDIFCHCAELNPEPHQEGEEENSWFFGDQEIVDAADSGSDSEWHISENSGNSIGRTNGDHDLTHRVHELRIDSQRFEDADEGEQESHDDHRLAG